MGWGRADLVEVHWLDRGAAQSRSRGQCVRAVSDAWGWLDRLIGWLVQVMDPLVHQLG
jgi:hypothetical protein